MVVMVVIAQHRHAYGLVLFAITSLLALLNKQQNIKKHEYINKNQAEYEKKTQFNKKQVWFNFLKVVVVVVVVKKR
jgi:hypothetical protein